MMIARDIAHRARRLLLKEGKKIANVELVLGVALIGALIMLALCAPFLSDIAPEDGSLRNRLQPFGTLGHWLGTDHIGRDIWVRLLAGLVWSTSVAVAATAISFAIGLVLGLLAAAYDGWPRAIVRWSIDTVIALPGLVVAISIISIIGQGWQPIVLTLGLLGWPVFARVVYAEASTIMKRNYVLNARLQGVAEWSILLGHVAPGLRPTLTVMLAFQTADMLIAESALSFLGIGAPLGAPTWGNMLAESRQYLLSAPQLVLAPGIAIILTVTAVNLLGDGLAILQRSEKAPPLL